MLLVAVIAVTIGPIVERAYKQWLAADWVRGFGREPGYEHSSNAQTAGKILENTIAKDMLSKVTFVHLDNKNLNEIHRLSDFPGLEHLEIASADVSDLSPLKVLTQLQHISISQNPVTDLTPIRRNTNLKRLYAYSTKISTIAPLNELSLLENVSLRDTPIQDVAPLSHHSNLEYLDISRTKVTNIEPLYGLKLLKTLDLTGTAIPHDQIEVFQQANPGCQVLR
jgi:Leucine-rich repeat (LRR) protein